MYNQAIVTSPVALFLGAGASKPLDKMLMGEFINFLEGEKNYSSSPLFQAITVKERDLEFLFEELEDWARKTYLGAMHRVRGQSSSSLGARRPVGGQSSSSPLDYAGDIIEMAAGLLDDLRKDVFQQYRQINEPAAVSPLFNPMFEPIFECIRPGKHCLPIFTTNYDPAIEEFRSQNSDQYLLDDGFEATRYGANHSWSREYFESLRVHDEKRHLVLFKLHGSTNWFRDKTTVPPRIVKSDLRIHLPGHADYENLLIYPAKRKILLDEPYFTAYDYFQRTLERCKLCIVIGYSFRDYDALSRLRSAASLNKHLKLLIVDPNAEELARRLKALGIHADYANSHFGVHVMKGIPVFPPTDQDYVAKIKAYLANLDSSDSTDPLGSSHSARNPG